MARYQVTTANETNWVRSLYAYGVLLVSGLAAVGGLLLAVVSVVVLINPQSGMSGWERVLVGVPTVLDEGIEIAESYLEEQQGELPEYCTADLTEEDPDFEYCEFVRESMEEPVIPAEAEDAIALVRDETLRQIRHGAIGKLVIGAVVFVLAALVFRRHRGLVSLYGRDEDAPAPARPVAATASEDTAPVPPPPPTI
jgi:hypothetical protein